MTQLDDGKEAIGMNNFGLISKCWVSVVVIPTADNLLLFWEAEIGFPQESPGWTCQVPLL